MEGNGGGGVGEGGAERGRGGEVDQGNQGRQKLRYYLPPSAAIIGSLFYSTACLNSEERNIWRYGMGEGRFLGINRK